MIRPLSAVLVGLLACSPALAQVKPEAKISGVRAGLPPGPMAGKEEFTRPAPVFKAGHWAPFLVTVEGKGRIEDVALTVQFTDADDNPSDYTITIPNLEFTAEQPSQSFVTYARPGKTDSAVTVSLKSRGQSLGQPYEVSPYPAEASAYLYLTIGSRLPAMRPPGADAKSMRATEVAAIDKVSELPEKWYGYQTADLVIWTTSDEKFTDALLNDSTKRSALFDWVRRGGKLLISVGKNRALLDANPQLKALLPVTLDSTTTVKSLRANFYDIAEDLTDPPPAKNLIDFTRMKKKPSAGVREFGTASQPLIAQGPAGFGKVTVVAFDLDQPPFTRWKQQDKFWERLLREAGPLFLDASKDADQRITNSALGMADDDLTSRVVGGSEAFDGVPVIAFGWVALFILVYIVVVGPLDYFFLKKVVKRLELTWVTFPLVVLLVSAGAYFAAYALKGDDQKINKLDLLDVDLASGSVRGTSWFTVFSPRIQNYTVGVEPGSTWHVAPLARDDQTRRLAADDAPLVSWLGKPKAGRQSLFRRSYEYDVDQGGLHRVPIQVWSTKGFQAVWHSRLSRDTPLIEADLRQVSQFNEIKLSGGIISHLPADLQEAALLYKDKAYALQTLQRGKENLKRLTGNDPQQVTTWAATPLSHRMYGSTYNNNSSQYVDPEPARGYIRSLMFHELSEQQNQNRSSKNGGLRDLDLSWRLRTEDPGDFAILVGKLAVQKGSAEDVLRHPSTATSLWLGGLPDGTDKRPAITGSLRQETYVRIIVPVKSGK